MCCLYTVVRPAVAFSAEGSNAKKNRVVYIMWYNEFNGVFFITILTIVAGSIGLCLKYCLKSKCDQVNLHCFGLGLDIHREVRIEEDVVTDIELATLPPII